MFQKKIHATIIFMRRAIYLMSIIALFFFGVPFTTNAQTTIGLNDVLEVKVNPEYPRAFESVNIKVQSFNSDLDRANITWYLNGTATSKGIGKTDFTFTTGAVGKTTSVRMEANTIGGGLVVRTFTFRPGDVDLLWEADSYTPPFYKGKKLHSNEGDIRIIALPTLIEKSGALASPENLVYDWRLGSKVLADQSGFGKQTLSLSKDVTFKSNFIVTVVISTLDGSSSAKGTIRISPIQPLVLFYEHSPVLGMLDNRVLSFDETLTLTTDELAISAHPFFFAVPTADSQQLRYEWFMNGREIDTPRTPNELTLRQTGGSGSARLELRLQHTKNLLQNAKTATIIDYTARSSSSLF